MRLLLRLAFAAAQLYWRVARPVTLGVRLILAQNGRVLLVKHSYRPGWYLVGGGAERGETLEQTARREAREEAGVELGALQLVGVYTSFAEQKTDHIVVFACEKFTPLPAAAADHEIESRAFFEADQLPADLVPGHRLRIQEYLAGGPLPRFGLWQGG